MYDNNSLQGIALLCLLYLSTNKNPNANKLSWAINYPSPNPAWPKERIVKGTEGSQPNTSSITHVWDAEGLFHPHTMSQSVIHKYWSKLQTKTAASAVQEKGRHPWMRPFPLPSHSSHWGVRYWKFVLPTTPPQMSQSVLQYRQAVRTTPLPYASPFITDCPAMSFVFVWPCEILQVCFTPDRCHSLWLTRLAVQEKDRRWDPPLFHICHPIHQIGMGAESLFHPPHHPRCHSLWLKVQEKYRHWDPPLFHLPPIYQIGMGEILKVCFTHHPNRATPP